MKNFLLVVMFAFVSVSACYAQEVTAPYPVSLSSFNAGLTNNAAVLKWQTVCYVSYANFQVQRSYNGTDFTTIHTFSASRLRCLQPFEFADEAPPATGNIYYRVNAGDIDGRFFESRIVKLVKNGSKTKMLQLYPTVVTSAANLFISLPGNEKVSLSISDMSGRIIRQLSFEVSSGVTNIPVNVNALFKGQYIAVASTSAGKRETIRFIKQ